MELDEALDVIKEALEGRTVEGWHIHVTRLDEQIKALRAEHEALHDLVTKFLVALHALAGEVDDESS